MEILNEGTSNERLNIRCRIEGIFMSERFIYEDDENTLSQFIWVNPDGDGQMDPSTFWWTEGSFGCDCNRSTFLPPHLKAKRINECGHEIFIDTITPIEGDNLPILELNESLHY